MPGPRRDLVPGRASVGQASAGGVAQAVSTETLQALPRCSDHGTSCQTLPPRTACHARSRETSDARTAWHRAPLAARVELELPVQRRSSAVSHARKAGPPLAHMLRPHAHDIAAPLCAAQQKLKRQVGTRAQRMIGTENLDLLLAPWPEAGAALHSRPQITGRIFLATSRSRSRTATADAAPLESSAAGVDACFAASPRHAHA